MGSEIYYDPQDHGLEIVAQHDFSDGSYCFDYRIVWREKATGRLLTARDAGCSCPSPFEDTSLADLAEFSESALVAEAREEARSDYYSGDPIEPWITTLRGLATR